MFSDSVITNVGNTIFNQWFAGANLTFNSVKCGSGTVPIANLKAQTALTNEKKTLSIISQSSDINGISLKVQLTSVGVTESFTLNQFGIWASVDGGSPAMVAIYQDSTGIVVPTYTDMPNFLYTFYLRIAISNASDFTFSIYADPSAFITEERLGLHESSTTPHGGGYAICSNSSGVTARTATLEGYKLIKGGLVVVHFTTSVPAAATLNINGQGAKQIYFNGVQITDGIILSGTKVLLQYDGTNYNIIARDLHTHTITADKAPMQSLSASAGSSLYSDRFYNLGTLTSHRTQVITGIQTPPDNNYHVWAGKITVNNTSYSLTFMTEDILPIHPSNGWKNDGNISVVNGTITFLSAGTYYFTLDTFYMGIMVKMA